MPIHVFEIACVAVVLLTLFVSARKRDPRALLRDYLALALAGYLGEESCITLYEFYGYAERWHLRLHHVPALVPLIWPLVILSAREVVDSLFGERKGWKQSALVASVVIVDASLVEVVAVRAELWTWAEGGHLGVPLIGVLGWGFFAGSADFLMRRGAPTWLLVPLAPLMAHVAILASWWGALRWVLRGDQGDAAMALVVIISIALALVMTWLRRHRRAIALEVAAPRMIAASLFFTLLVMTAPRSVPLWMHTAAVAVPYLVATRYTFSGKPAANQAAVPAK